MKKVLILIPLVCLSGCATKRPVVVQMPRSVTGTVLTPECIESLRYAENLKMYPVGRYIDPNNDLVMHEAHALYRAETTAMGNLHSNTAAHLLNGPVLGILPS